IPPGMPGYQPSYPGLPFDINKARTSRQSAYPDISKMPQIIFSYPNSEVSQAEATALQAMWQAALGIQLKLLPVEPNAYDDEMTRNEIQFGFKVWNADFPDPYDWLALKLLSSSPNNNGRWNNSTFDQLVMEAEQTSGDARIAMCDKEAQIAITVFACIPPDHKNLTA